MCSKAMLSMKLLVVNVNWVMSDRRPDICNSALKEHIGSSGLLKKHFQDCDVMPSFEMVKILGREKLEKLLTLEALFISEIKPTLNTKDEFKSRNLLLKF